MTADRAATPVVDEGVEQRYFELRYDGDRTISGTAIRYGDTAKLPWGDKERFAPGVFGEVEAADVLLNVQHERARPIARTQGGGLTLVDTITELRVEAQLPDTTDGNDAISLVRNRVLRGLSVEFVPRTDRLVEGVTVIESAELRGVAIVDRPAYPKSTINARTAGGKGMEPDTLAEAIAAILKEELAETRSDDAIDPAAVAEAVASALTPKFAEQANEAARAQVEKALEERDEAQRQLETADADAKAAEENRVEAEEAAEDRAMLIVQVRELLPENTDTKGMSTKDILVAAAGDEVDDADERSEDYLLAKVEAILERRLEAREGDPKKPPATKSQQNQDGPVFGDTVNVISMVERRRQAAAG